MFKFLALKLDVFYRIHGAIERFIPGFIGSHCAMRMCRSIIVRCLIFSSFFIILFAHKIQSCIFI